MKKKTKAQIRRNAVRYADNALREYVILRDGLCVNCGSTENLQCGHLFSRVAYSTRWDPKNIFCQCKACNFKHEYDPGPLTMYFVEHYGWGEYSMLHSKFKTPFKYTTEEILKIGDDIKELTRRLKENADTTEIWQTGMACEKYFDKFRRE